MTLVFLIVVNLLDLMLSKDDWWKIKKPEMKQKP